MKTFQTIVFQGVNFLLQVVFALLAARALQIEQQGTYALVRTSVFLGESLLWFGLSSGVTYFVAKDFEKYHDVILNGCLWYLSLLSVLVSVVVAVLPSWIFAAGFSKSLIFLSILWTVSLGATQIFQKIFLGQRRYGAFNGISLTATILLYPWLYFLWHAGKLNLSTIVWGHLFSNVAAILASVYLHRSWTRRLSFSEILNKEIIGALYSIGIKSFLSTMSFLVLYRLDFFFVGYFLGRRALGLYSISVFVIESVQKIPDWMGMILSPKVTAQPNDSYAITKKYLLVSLGYVVLLGALMAAVNASPFKFVQFILGADYAGAEKIAVLLLPRAFLHAAMVIFAANLAGKGYTFYHPLAGIMSLAVLAACDWVMIPRLGLNGAIGGITLAYLFATAVMAIGCLKIKPHEPTDQASLDSGLITINN